MGSFRFSGFAILKHLMRIDFSHFLTRFLLSLSIFFDYFYYLNHVSFIIQNFQNQNFLISQRKNHSIHTLQEVNLLQDQQHQEHSWEQEPSLRKTYIASIHWLWAFFLDRIIAYRLLIVWHPHWHSVLCYLNFAVRIMEIDNSFLLQVDAHQTISFSWEFPKLCKLVSFDHVQISRETKVSL